MMITRRAAPHIVLALLAFGATVAHAIEVTTHEGVVTGRIFDSTTNEGISGMTVKLTPPRATGRPARVTLTDSQGAFEFREPAKGRYLLEVHQGATLLYRRVIDTARNSKFQVQLRQKRS